MNKEYIERKEVSKLANKLKSEFAPLHRLVIDALVYSINNNIPSADVVEVVRCKDCKHWHKCLSDDGSVEYIHFSRCTKGNQLANGNDYFCSLGERISN